MPKKTSNFDDFEIFNFHGIIFIAKMPFLTFLTKMNVFVKNVKNDIF